MGRGIAHVCALAGLDVVLTDIHEEALRRVTETILRDLTRQVGRGKIREEGKDAAIERIHTGRDYAEFADCDMVIEAATEKEGVKSAIFRELVPVLKPEALIATNTSSISITRLARSEEHTSELQSPYVIR